MNREILFKAKRKDTNEWVYGNYVYTEYEDKHYITQQLENTHQLIEVIPETVSQYTGLNDKNGKKIFEGDIMKNRKGGIGIVKYTRYAETVLDFINDVSMSGFNPAILRNYEVIGNIHDKKEN